MDTTDREIKLVNEQIIVTFIFVVTLIVSLLILYNKRQKLKYDRPFIDDETNKKIIVLNSIMVFLLLLFLIYSSYEALAIDKIKGEKVKNDYLALAGSVLTAIAGIIILYISFTGDSSSEAPIMF